MAGTATSYSAATLHQGPGDLWIIGTPPNDATVRLTLAADLTPDATAHPGSIHMGGTEESINIVLGAKQEDIGVDQFGTPLDAVIVSEEFRIEAVLKQAQDLAKLQYALKHGTYSTASGYKQLTFGGKAMMVEKFAVAVIAPTKNDPTKAIVALIFSAYSIPTAELTIARNKPMVAKCGFKGLYDTARTAGKAMGVIYVTE